MEAGEAAEEAAEEAGSSGEVAAAEAGLAGGEGEGEVQAPAPPLHKSRSQQAAAVLDRNLAELASEWAGGREGMERGADASEAAEPAAPQVEE